ncbi:hypothetical protein Nwi_2828 [Nitrobacter winogradskyi Nb-255]|uniref:Uncharacterized protein n=1 Tax=Nitrobacter winogradskyi (strain ATCC 25391 / DSM 10237 / CIP 104748 / NCIMB 11846 / Nb-255) TaxID=323098 RepID=Q3SNR0_NITWN|nr:hypothetical protein [Nitrobacter winogradskyi]ABA06081.1 hypothetical protein Nwi_2828 [Nitrobacter winogradskyi Nb-255]
MSTQGIEAFQDLTLAPAQGDLNAIRTCLVNHQTPDWVHDADQETELRKYSGGDEDIIQFRYVGSDRPMAALTLWQRENGYAVTNIVPAEQGQLSVSEYNALLQDFVRKVVQPAQREFEFNVNITEPVRQLDSWISKGAAESLRRFSVLANKSTTNSHPNDAERWEQFVVAVHLGGPPLGTDILIQWLVEIDGWDEQSAQKLAIDYEKGISLLETYDRLTRG